MISKSFYESLESIANERGISIEKILEKVEIAMQIACKNSDVPYKGDIKMEYDIEKKEIKFENAGMYDKKEKICNYVLMSKKKKKRKKNKYMYNN